MQILGQLFFLSMMFADYASYRVPTDVPVLVRWSHFEVRIACEVSSGKRVIQYNYPVLLTGVEQVITMTQDGLDPARYAGEKGEMSCLRGECFVQFHDLAFDKDALQTKLELASKTPSELAARSELAWSNKVDPGGFLENPNEYCP